jgi:hypothetical protein
MEQKLVSIIIPNWNGMQFLKTCLDAVLAQDYRNIEIIVVDCNSSDDSVRFIRENYPSVNLIAQEEDHGGPAADNVACGICKGDYIMLLNNDVIVPNHTIQKMVDELEKDERCVINPIQLNWDKEYISAGYCHPWIGPYLYKFVNNNGAMPFYPSLACCLLTKKLFQEIPLNEHLFLYEDTEWGWRLHLNRIKIKVIFDAAFYHKDAGTIGGSPKQAFINGRVAIATQYICFNSFNFGVFFPLLLIDYLRRYIAYGNKPALRKAFIRGYNDFFKMKDIFKEDRKKVQRERLIGDGEIMRIIVQSIGFDKNAKIKWQQVKDKVLAE